MSRGKDDQSAGEWIPTFLVALGGSGIISDAAKKAGVRRETAYDRRKSDPAFANDWDTAMQCAFGLLEDEAFRRGLDKSDRMLEVMLAAGNRGKYGRQAHVTVDPLPDGDDHHEMTDEDLAVIAAEGIVKQASRKKRRNGTSDNGGA